VKVAVTPHTEKISAHLDCLTRLACWVQVQEMACNGRNWGDAEIDSATLVFRVGNKPAFRIPLQDVGQVQQVPPSPQLLSPTPLSRMPCFR